MIIFILLDFYLQIKSIANISSDKSLQSFVKENRITIWLKGGTESKFSAYHAKFYTHSPKQLTQK